MDKAFGPKVNDRNKADMDQFWPFKGVLQRGSVQGYQTYTSLSRYCTGNRASQFNKQLMLNQTLKADRRKRFGCGI
jgi:hypothetical protein